MLNQQQPKSSEEVGSKKSGYETPKFSQETQGSKRAPTATATFLLELQHSQITEVNSEYEVTQNDTKAPKEGSACTSQQTFSFAQSAKDEEQWQGQQEQQEQQEYDDEAEYGEYYQE